jgi:fluoroacetyl-CoA thioesterase
MNQIFKPGDKKEFRKIIEAGDVAAFQGMVIHPVYATFSLARDAEWTSRQFVLEMKSPGEEGIGTFLTVEHKGPAFVGEEISFVAWVDHIEGNELVCFYEARVSDRLIAIGKTGQRIFSTQKLEAIFSRPSR